MYSGKGMSAATHAKSDHRMKQQLTWTTISRLPTYAARYGALLSCLVLASFGTYASQLSAAAAVVIIAAAGLLKPRAAASLQRTVALSTAALALLLLALLLVSQRRSLAPAVVMPLLAVLVEAATAVAGASGSQEGVGGRTSQAAADPSTPTPGLLLFRLSAPLYFNNLAWARARLSEQEARGAQHAAAHGTKLQFVIWDLAPISYMDTQGVDLIEELLEYFHSKGVQLVLVDPSPKVQQLWDRTGFAGRLQQGQVMGSVQQAVQLCGDRLVQGGCSSWGLWQRLRGLQGAGQAGQEQRVAAASS